MAENRSPNERSADADDSPHPVPNGKLVTVTVKTLNPDGGGGTFQELQLVGPEIGIGREGSCKGLLEDNLFISRTHLNVKQFSTGLWKLCYVGSNPSYLNGEKLERDEWVPLQNGDEISLPTGDENPPKKGPQSALLPPNQPPPRFSDRDLPHFVGIAFRVASPPAAEPEKAAGRAFTVRVDEEEAILHATLGSASLVQRGRYIALGTPERCYRVPGAVVDPCAISFTGPQGLVVVHFVLPLLGNAAQQLVFAPAPAKTRRMAS